jgi:hypothetical protein
MNALPILSVILGIISIIITMNYIKHYDKLNYSMNKISANCVPKNKKLYEITDIQDTLELTDYEFNELIKINKDKIMEILKEPVTEKFINYKYIDHKQRDLDSFKFTGLINY